MSVDQDIIVTISDTGIGIPEAELPHIFDRFYKADKARNRARSGSGLGLSIVKTVIGMHKGHIEVHSRSGEGTAFTITIPRL
ncbi:Alkaline phosphatase synthesis sensor protein PhoR [compost metagenome]